MARKPIEVHSGDREAIASAIVESREREGKEPQSEHAEILADAIAEQRAIKQETSRGHALLQCAESGLQTLVDRFGAQQVADAFVRAESAPQSGANNPPSILDVVRILAPNAADRQEIYTAIDASASAIELQVKSGVIPAQEDITNQNSLPNPGDIERYRMTVHALRTLDAQGVGAKIKQALGGTKYERLWLDNIMDTLRAADLLREPEVLVEKLQEGAGDMRHAAAALIENARESREDLAQRIMETQLLLVDMFDRTTAEALHARDAARLSLIRDKEALLAQDMKSPVVRKSVEDAIARATEQLDQHEQETNERIERATKEHRALLTALAQAAV